MKEIKESDIIHLQMNNKNMISHHMLFNFIVKMKWYWLNILFSLFKFNREYLGDYKKNSEEKRFLALNRLKNVYKIWSEINKIENYAHSIL